MCEICGGSDTFFYNPHTTDILYYPLPYYPTPPRLPMNFDLPIGTLLKHKYINEVFVIVGHIIVHEHRAYRLFRPTTGEYLTVRTERTPKYYNTLTTETK